MRSGTDSDKPVAAHESRGGGLTGSNAIAGSVRDASQSVGRRQPPTTVRRGHTAFRMSTIYASHAPQLQNSQHQDAKNREVHAAFELRNRGRGALPSATPSPKLSAAQERQQLFDPSQPRAPPRGCVERPNQGADHRLRATQRIQSRPGNHPSAAHRTLDSPRHHHPSIGTQRKEHSPRRRPLPQSAALHWSLPVPRAPRTLARWREHFDRGLPFSVA